MARPTFCYWAVAPDEYADLAASMVASARRAGVRQPFHIWTNREIPGAICHPSGVFQTDGWLFKFVFLRDEVSRLPYERLVYLDSDTWFVRDPGDPASLLGNDPIHSSLDSDMHLGPDQMRWWEYPVETYRNLMRAAGIRQPTLHSVNGGMFIVRRDAVEDVYAVADDFHRFGRENGVILVDEPILSYVTQRFCTDVRPHLLANTHQIWATDLFGSFKSEVPRGKPFVTAGMLQHDRILVNPAMVHMIHGKRAMLRENAVMTSGRGEP